MRQRSRQRGSGRLSSEPPVLSPLPTRPLQVNYPDTALQLHEKGYVVVEFMLHPDGSTSALTIADSMPPRVFDREALQAVKGARFVTQGLADAAKAQRARVKINFHARGVVSMVKASVWSRVSIWPLLTATGSAAALTALLLFGMQSVRTLQAASTALQRASELSGEPQVTHSVLSLVQRSLENRTFAGDSLQSLEADRERDNGTIAWCAACGRDQRRTGARRGDRAETRTHRFAVGGA